MEYTNEQFMKLEDLILDQGGQSLDMECADVLHPLSGPVGAAPSKRVRMEGCGNSGVLFLVPYENMDGELAPILLCAVCDDLGAKPRFAEAMR
jgi:hypothetical protein